MSVCRFQLRNYWTYFTRNFVSGVSLHYKVGRI